MKLTNDEKKLLLSTARQSILSALNESTKPTMDYSANPLLKQNLGAFVTLKINEQLRGCIGYIVAIGPLFDTICETARSAAFNDPRFNPLTREEFDKIKIEISVLSPLEPITSYDDIEVGKHGLLLDEGGRGVLLPQVATENNFNRAQFLTALCHKAGMHGEYWKERMLKLKIFTATVFSEE
ncbi:MAG: AmmeMemoRadiSam system protein A [Ignavibacteria bacterium]|nr:MAG: AmmeMemoRadiSam system protein A [Ignavibacteria bacterium]